MNISISMGDPKWEDLIEALEDGEIVDRLNWRHGHKSVRVIDWKGKKYRTTIDVHHEEGWQIDGVVELEEVKPVERTVIVWVRV